MKKDLHLRRRNGKVARLPDAIRAELNQMLRDGISYPRITAWLTTRGFPGFNAMNLSRWAQGGYDDWLAEREREREHRDRYEWALEMAKSNDGISMSQAALNLNVSQFMGAALHIDSRTMADKLSRRPDKYCTAMNTLFKATRELRRIEFANQLKKRHAARERDAASPGPDRPASHPITPSNGE
jgi:hypothetical protein